MTQENIKKQIFITDILLIAAVVLSVISGCQYFYGVRDILFPKKKAK